MLLEIDQHAAALDRLHRELVDAERHRIVVAALVRRDHIGAGAIAVVEAGDLLAAAVEIEGRSDMGEAVPLRRVLRAHQHGVVADHVAEEMRLGAHTRVEHRIAVALGRLQRRRKADRRQRPAAGIVERQAEAERPPFPHLLRRAQHGLARDVVQAAELIVVAELAPVRPFRPLLPALRHPLPRRSYGLIEKCHLARRAHRLGQPREIAQQRAGLARIDDLLDPELFGRAERRLQLVEARLDLLQFGRGIVGRIDLGAVGRLDAAFQRQRAPGRRQPGVAQR